MTKRKKNIKEQASSIDDKNTSDAQCPVWNFGYIDRDGKFAFDMKRKDFDCELVLSKMIDYSHMPWREIKRQTHDDGRSKNHTLEVSDRVLTKEALKRIELKIDPNNRDSIFSFALNNLVRIIGVRMGAEFRVIWYDPNHEFAKTSKKHT